MNGITTSSAVLQMHIIKKRDPDPGGKLIRIRKPLDTCLGDPNNLYIHSKPKNNIEKKRKEV